MRTRILPMLVALLLVTSAAAASESPQCRKYREEVAASALAFGEAIGRIQVFSQLLGGPYDQAYLEQRLDQASRDAAHHGSNGAAHGHPPKTCAFTLQDILDVATDYGKVAGARDGFVEYADHVGGRKRERMLEEIGKTYDEKVPAARKPYDDIMRAR